MIPHAIMQLEPIKGSLRANLAKLKQALELLQHQHRPEVVVLPETFTSGYFLQGGVRELALTQEQLIAELDTLYHSLNWDGSLDIVVGFYEQHAGIYYNASMYLECNAQGSVLRHVHRKIFLPTYGIFDEERYISPGNGLKAFDTRFGRAAMLICEDFWHSITGTLAALDGAQTIYVPSASPARGFSGTEPANVARWKSLAQAVAAEHGVYVVIASLVGIEAGKAMSGGSGVTAPDGTPIATAPVFEEAVLLCDIDLDRIAPIRYDNPLLADLESGLGLLTKDWLRLGRTL